MSRRRIWILSEVYFPEMTSTGYHITKIAESQAAEFDVKVLTGPPTERFERTAAPSHEWRNCVEVFRCQGTSFPKDWLPGRLVNAFSRSAAIFLRGLTSCRRGDVVMSVTNPPLLPFVAMALKWLTGCRFVLLIFDVYPQVLVASGIARATSPVVALGERLNRLLYRQADRIVSLGRDMTQLILAKLTPDDTRVRQIANWADETGEPPGSPRATPTDVLTVLYAGNIGRTHDIESLVAAADTLRGQPGIRFVVAGFGAKLGWLRRALQERDLTNVELLPPASMDDYMGLLAASDVTVIPFVPGMAGVSVPSRMYNQMAAGKPLVALTDDWSELARVVREEDIGWVLSPGDVEGLTRAILEAASQPERCQAMGARAAMAARTKYTLDVTAQRYKALFEELFAASI